ncbi:MAG: DUF6786 family protein [Bacteroidota bacterium]|jgi:hypothetical protein
MKWIIFVMAAVLVIAESAAAQDSTVAPTFGDDLAFLKKYKDVVVLSDSSGAMQVAIVPDYQGRIMTSTADGTNGTSFGWVNRELISSGKKQQHINVFGGEDRFWIGPEGGQFSVFFAKGSAFDLDHWFTPPSVDTEPFKMVSNRADRVTCRREIHLTNYSGTKFRLEVSREIRLLDRKGIQRHLAGHLSPRLKMVGFESVNSIKNLGKEPWKKESGLLSIWILGMLNASPSTTIVVPFKKGPESELGPVVNDAYFGKVPPERLVVKDGLMFFSADANYRSKIGLSPLRCKAVLGSYDAQNHVLTVVQYTLPEGATDYVNSMWKIQENPFGGDVVNSYNDGPPAPAKPQLGRFYELETSSPALALKPGGIAKHTHRTIHIQGNDADLDPVARAVFGVGIEDIKNGLKK